jgi:tRNA(Ile)-lysidine synthase
LRHAASSLGVSLSFEATETVRQLALNGSSGKKISLPGQIMALRSARELRLLHCSLQPATGPETEAISLPVPGKAMAFGFQFVADSPVVLPSAVIRNWRSGDRVTLRYSRSPRKIKEVLERLKISGSDRNIWPVVEWQGNIVWMRGTELQPNSELAISATEVNELS